MTPVSFYLRMPLGSLPGIAVGTMWPASANGPFQVHEFTLPYGGDDVPHSHRFESGNYWVQLKLHTGEIIRELVAIPDETHASVHLSSGDVGADSGKQRGLGNNNFPPQLLDESSTAPLAQSLPERRVLLPRGGARGGQMGLILKGSTTPVAPRKRPWEPHHHPNYFIFPEIGDHRFSLTSLRTRPSYWRSRQGVGGREWATLLTPQQYFREVLLSRDRAAMVPTVEGNDVSTLIEGGNDLGDPRGELQPAVRDYALLDGAGQRYRFLVGLPRLHRANWAKLIVRADQQDPQRRVRLSIHVDDPSFKSPRYTQVCQPSPRAPKIRLLSMT